jgi:hypothetical protein
MKDDYGVQFLVSTSTAVLIAVFNLAIVGQINWVWVIVAFAIPFSILQLYQRPGLSTPRTYRVMHDATQLRAKDGNRSGKGAWEFDASTKLDHVIYGPYIPLSRARYRASFRLKVNDRPGDHSVAEIDVCAPWTKVVSD